MFLKYKSLMLFTVLLFVGNLLIAADFDNSIKVTSSKYRYDKKDLNAFIIENSFYKATLVPDAGGRILSLINKKLDLDLIYSESYGGLLDDHGAMFKLPYKVKWLKKNEKEVVVELSGDNDGKVYIKTVTFSGIRPVIEVEYHVENHTQNPLRLLFRNVVRPSGAKFDGNEIYSYTLNNGIRKGHNIPRVDFPAEQWSAVTYPAKKSTIGIAFEGDALERLYTWGGSKVAPTFEYMMRRLPAGSKIDFNYYWLFCTGLNEIDYASRDCMAELTGKVNGKNLILDMDLIPLWHSLNKLKISGTLLDEKRQVIGTIETKNLTKLELYKVQKIKLTATINKKYEFVSAIINLESYDLNYSPQIVEKSFPENRNKGISNLNRPTRIYGDKNIIEKIKGWSKEIAYEVEPNQLANERGYMVFEEYGPTAGKPIKEVNLQVGIKEYDSFPLHFKSLGWSGEVKIEVDTPSNITVESFNTIKMPEKLWGKMHYGLKMLPATTFTVSKDEDKVIYFRIQATTDTKAGLHNIKIKFIPDNKPPINANININVYPITFPPQPKMVFDVNNVVNYLCASRKNKGAEYKWDPIRANNYMKDMRNHGVRGQTLGGLNSPEATYYYDKVKILGSDISLTDSIKNNPEKFKNRIDLPKLDFSYWNFLVDKLLEYEQRNVRWTAGGCGSGFYQKHNKLTKLIYKKTFPDNDTRQNIVRDWYNSEVIRYLKDRGITRTLVTIDDEIPSEKLAWWVQHANAMIACKAEPGVTQSAHTLADKMLINIVAPFMKFWIIGTLHKETLDLRRKQGIIKAEHWQTTYHSSANHWQKYSQTRSQCGFNTAFFELDSCWIQVYYRWRQSEAIIYPSKDKPYDSAAWEGARDGFDDGNYYLLALSMIRALPKAEYDLYIGRLKKIIGEDQGALIKFTERLTGLGHVTSMGQYNGKVFNAWYNTIALNKAKGALLDLIKELTSKVPIQKAAADFGVNPLIRDGRSIFALPAGMASINKAEDFLQKVAEPLEFIKSEPIEITQTNRQAIFFFGTVDELNKLLPMRAKESQLSDLNKDYPSKGQYIIRFIRPSRSKENNKMVKGKYLEPEYPKSLYIIFADSEGAEKALRLLPKVVSQPKFLYSNWLKKHTEK